jgi:hypothetical protein
MFNKRLTFSTLLVAAMACASAPSSDPGAAAAPGRNGDVISAAELSDPSLAGVDLFDAVQRLRPRFLTSRGAVTFAQTSSGSTHVSVDGGPLYGLDHLTRLRPNQVAEVRLLSAADAAQRFGASATSGSVILVKSK